MRISLFVLGLVFIPSAAARADTVTMKSGRTIECEVIHDGLDGRVTIRIGRGKMVLPREAVASIAYKPFVPTTQPTTRPARSVEVDVRKIAEPPLQRRGRSGGTRESQDEGVKPAANGTAKSTPRGKSQSATARGQR